MPHLKKLSLFIALSFLFVSCSPEPFEFEDVKVKGVEVKNLTTPLLSLEITLNNPNPYTIKLKNLKFLFEIEDIQAEWEPTETIILKPGVSTQKVKINLPIGKNIFSIGQSVKKLIAENNQLILHAQGTGKAGVFLFFRTFSVNEFIQLGKEKREGNK